MKRLPLALSLTLALTAACGAGFAPKHQVTGVRILAARAEAPFARPGESVKVQLLAHDARKAPAEPMKIYWFPAPCVAPPGDLYWACYAGVHSLFPDGDLTPYLATGSETTVTIPPNALDGATPRAGTSERSVSAFVFVAACGGHLERVPLRSGQGPNQLPVGCFDASGRRLAEDDFVFGFTRIFVFDTRRNEIPRLDGVTLEGKPVDPAVGISTATCPKDGAGQCKNVKLDVTFDDAMSETDPDNVDADGRVGRETLYVDWFTTAGKLAADRKILFDAYLGRPPKTEIDLEPPRDPVRGTIWAVLHDNRGGTTWLEMPLEFK